MVIPIPILGVILISRRIPKSPPGLGMLSAKFINLEKEANYRDRSGPQGHKHRPLLAPPDGLIPFIPQTLFHKLFKHRIRFA